MVAKRISLGKKNWPKTWTNSPKFGEKGPELRKPVQESVKTHQGLGRNGNFSDWKGQTEPERVNGGPNTAKWR